MKLLTKKIRQSLPKLYTTEGLSYAQTIARVKFFTPDSSWTWYAVEFDGQDTFFGLVVGEEIEFGYFSLSELQSIRGHFGLRVERDMYFGPTPVTELAAYQAWYARMDPREQFGLPQEEGA